MRFWLSAGRGRRFGRQLSADFSYYIEYKSVLERDLPQVIVSAGGSPVSGSHVGPQQQPASSGLPRPELRGPLGRFPVRHSGIVEPRSKQHVGVILRRHVVIGGV